MGKMIYPTNHVYARLRHRFGIKEKQNEFIKTALEDGYIGKECKGVIHFIYKNFEFVIKGNTIVTVIDRVIGKTF
jgi:hypothetical protein